MNELPVDVVRSERRKKTVQGSLTGGRIKVMVPAGMDEDEERRVVNQMAARITRKHSSGSVDLTTRARALSREHNLKEPVSIVWSDRQNTRWGSCTPTTGRVRISTRVAAMPLWVLDSVIVHELAHLEVDNHGPEFQELVDRYELTERASGYLMAKAEADV